MNDTATTEIYTLSLHDALPISGGAEGPPEGEGHRRAVDGEVDQGVEHEERLERQGDEEPEAHGGLDEGGQAPGEGHVAERSEEHTSEFPSRHYFVCGLLLVDAI